MNYNAGEYDIAVIGAGHAGCEAALASARLGKKTLLFSISLEAIANMPCNPHIGGTSKGHLVREIDALGGEMGKNIDKTFTQIKMLNKSKGPAVYSLRAQADRKKYHIEMKHTLENQENLYIKQAEIINIEVEDKKVKRKSRIPARKPAAANNIFCREASPEKSELRYPNADSTSSCAAPSVFPPVYSFNTAEMTFFVSGSCSITSPQTAFSSSNGSRL